MSHWLVHNTISELLSLYAQIKVVSHNNSTIMLRSTNEHRIFVYTEPVYKCNYKHINTSQTSTIA